MDLQYGDRIRVYGYGEPVEGMFTERKPVPAIGAHNPLVHFIANGEQYERFVGPALRVEKIGEWRDSHPCIPVPVRSLRGTVVTLTTNGVQMKFEFGTTDAATDFINAYSKSNFVDGKLEM